MFLNVICTYSVQDRTKVTEDSDRTNGNSLDPEIQAERKYLQSV